MLKILYKEFMTMARKCMVLGVNLEWSTSKERNVHAKALPYDIFGLEIGNYICDVNSYEIR
jgi:hypothetical protein